MIEAGNEKFFINTEGRHRKIPPKNREYLLYRRVNTNKKDSDSSFEYGIGEFFYNNAGEIISYDENPPNLKYDHIDDIIMNIEMLYQALNKHIILLDELDGKGIEIKKETRADVEHRKRMLEHDKIRKEQLERINRRNIHE